MSATLDEDEPSPFLTADEVASDPLFGGLVVEALVAKAHETLFHVEHGVVWNAKHALKDGETAPTIEQRFAAWVAVYAGSYRHTAAMAVLSDPKAPANVWSRAWVAERIDTLWSSLAHAAVGVGMVP